MRKLPFLFFVLLLLGCGNGFHLDKVVDTYTESRTVDGVSIIIRVNKIRSDRYHLLRPKRENGRVKHHTTDYSFQYDLKVENRPWLEDVDYYGESEQSSAEEAIKYFEIDFSPDKQHFSVGRYYKIYHMLAKGQPFQVIEDDAVLEDFEKPDWSRMKSTAEMIKEHIRGNTKLYHPENIATAIQEQSPGSEIDDFALEHYYKNELSSLILDSSRVAQNKRNTRWKNRAKFMVLDSTLRHPYFDHFILLGLHMNDSEIFSVIDKEVANAESIHLYYIAQRPMYTAFTAETEALMNKAILTEFESGKVNGPDAEFYFSYALQLKSREIVKKCINGVLTPGETDGAIRYIESNYSRFKKDEQQMIIEKCILAIDADPTFSWQIMTFIKDKIPCERFFELKNKYPEYKNEAPPKGCREI